MGEASGVDEQRGDRGAAAVGGAPDAARPARRTRAEIRVGLGLAVGAAVAMGGAAPALKAMGSGGLSAVNVIQARTAVGAVVLLLVAAVVSGRRMKVRVGDWWLVALYGVISLAVNQVVFTMSLARLPVGVALLLEYLSPVLVALWVRLVQRRDVSGLVWAGIALTLVGLALVGEVWSGFDLDGVGVLLGLLAALTLAARFLLAERGLRSYDPLVMAAWGTALSAVVLALAGVVEPFPFAVLSQDVDLRGAPVPMGALVVWVGLIGMAGGIALGVAAQRRLPPTSASLLLTLEVAAGAVLAYFVLGEVMTGAQLLGAAVMLSGIALAQVAVTRRSARG
ncbi:EamA family transporter [Saccharothrix algeriensis]|uniref:Drug/metabolite transporter (DMT)-like permease n=2 Tax=Saccharothrix algeriensis TaxID=173560 RepID=A0ABS2S2I3_9PSEU|nr:EamA family transporter [Saccharothrix algeriensis]MBM7810448.1 drug/metabolite transporter (DMT)-like permease [Saccharothrix algeriensis]